MNEGNGLTGSRVGISTHPDTCSQGRISRRRLVGATAWAVPAILAVEATPAFAASNQLILEFNRASYSAQGCFPLTRASVSASMGGIPQSGISVSATLSSPFTFAGSGGRTFTGTTDGNGKLMLPDISIPASGASGTISAVSATSNASASITAATSNGVAFRIWNQDGGVNTAPSIPGDSSPLWGTFFLTPSTATPPSTVLDFQGNVILSNVSRIGGTFWDPQSNIRRAPVVLTDGTLGVWDHNGFVQASPGVPGGSTPLWGIYFHTPPSATPSSAVVDVFGNVIASDIGQLGGAWFNGSTGEFRQPVRLTDGRLGIMNQNGYVQSGPGVAGDSTPLWDIYFRTAATASVPSAIVNYLGDVVVADVQTVGEMWWDTATGAFRVPIVKSDGSLGVWNESGFVASTVALPGGSSPIWDTYFLTSASQLMDIFGNVAISGVNSVGSAWWASNGSFNIPVNVEPASC